MTDSRKRPASALLELHDAEAEARLKALEARPEVAELKQALKQLPGIEPDPSLWASIQDRAGSGSTESHTSARLSHPRLAQAAGLLLALTAGIFGVNALRDSGMQQTLPPEPVLSRSIDGEAIQALRTRSRQLEPIAQNYGSDPVASAFRYRIADVDSQLTDIPEGRLNQEEVQRLWGQRVALLESLAEVRRARAALQPAVY